MNPYSKLFSLLLLPAILLSVLTACGSSPQPVTTSAPEISTPTRAPTQPATAFPTATSQPQSLQDEERVLARAILPFADGALCNWQILGKNAQEVYAWVMCQMSEFPNSAAAGPVIIKLDAQGHYGQVVQSESEPVILELLPAAVQKRVLDTDFEPSPLQQRMTERLADPSQPPLVITAGALEVPPPPPLPTPTPAPTRAVLPPLINPTLPANPTLNLSLIQHWGEGPVDSAAWSPDGRQVAMLRSTGVSLHSAATLKETQFFPTASRVTALAYRPDGIRLAAGLEDGTAIIWDLATGQVVRTFSSDGPVQFLAFSPNGKKLLEAYIRQASAVNLWDADSGGLLKELTFTPDVFMDVFFTPDGQALAWVYGGPSQPEWDVAQGKTIRILSVDWPMEAVHNPDGSLFATATQAGLIQVWQPDGEGFTLLKTYQATGPVTNLAFDPASGRLALVNERGEVWLWDWQNDQARMALALPDPATNGNNTVSDLRFSPDGKFLLTVLAGQAQTWDMQSGKALAAYAEPTLASAGLFLNDGRLIMTTSDQQAARLVDVKNNTVLQEILANLPVPSPLLTISPNGAWMTASDANSVVDVFPTGTQHAVIHIQPAPGWLQGQAFSPDGKQVLLCFTLGDTVSGLHPQSLVQLWDLTTGQMRYSLKTSMLGALAIDPAGKWFALGGYDAYVTIYDLETGDLLQTLQGPADRVTALAAAGDKSSAYLAAGSQDGTICIWDTHTWNLLHIFGPRLYAPNGSPMPAAITALAFQPAGGLLVSASAGGWLRMWNPATGALLAEQRAHADDITTLSFRQDGTQLATASRDGTLRLWGIK
jgi:WD40 repeat protein